MLTIVVGSGSLAEKVAGELDGYPISLAESRDFEVDQPIALVVLRGVRTRWTAGGDRREWYGATSVVAVTSIEGEWRGVALGALAPVTPPCRFGFSSTPREPGVTQVVTTIETL